jgi:hypothetical protein
VSELIGEAAGEPKRRAPARLNWRLVIALWVNLALWGLIIGAVGRAVS